MQNDLKENVDMEINAREHLDCKGLRCPLPIVKLSKAIKQMAAGQTIVVEASDPAFKSDVQAWVKTMDFELLEFKEGPVQTAVIRKS
jgi:TusA-related sulfurtransferase